MEQSLNIFLLKKETKYFFNISCAKSNPLCRDIKRGCPPQRDGLMCDLLWSDPREDILGRRPNERRGYSCEFGPDVTARFLRQNGLLYVVRSHECVQYGYDLCHDDKVGVLYSILF